MDTNYTITDDADTVQVVVREGSNRSGDLVQRLTVEDTVGTDAKLTVFAASEASELSFDQGEWYELQDIDISESDPLTLVANKQTTGRSIERPSSIRSEGSHSTILHVGDTHRDYHPTDSERDAEYARDALRRVVDVATQRDVDAVIHTGNIEPPNDGHDGLAPRTVASLHSLASQEIEFYYLHGQHDQTGDAWQEALKDHEASTHLSSNQTVAGGVSLFGVDYQTDEWWDDPALSFDDPGDTPSLVCFHRLVNDVVPHQFSTTAVGDILEVLPFKPVAVALGSDGVTTQANIEGTPVYYAGAKDRDENGADLTLNLFSISDAGADVERLSLKTSSTATYTVRLARGTTEEELNKEIGSLTLPTENVVVELVTAPNQIEREDVVRGFEKAGAKRVTVLESDSEAAKDLVPGVYEKPTGSLEATKDSPTVSFVRAAHSDYRVGITLPC